ncbi:MAG TPA: hypothetical protein VEO19_02790 [Terriglobia bacterium]|nr:hypothetical protein [Terriglobia bacterium]
MRDSSPRSLQFHQGLVIPAKAGIQTWIPTFAGVTTVARALLLAQVVGILFLLACGVQGPPQPPRVELPERVTDLTVDQVGRRLEIRFALPQLAVDGERLTKPLEIEILRAPLPSGSQPSKSPSMVLWTRLQPSQWARYSNDGKLIYPALLSEEEYKNWQGEDSLIAVRTLTRGFRHRALESEFSKLVRLRVLDVSSPVEQMQSKVTEKAIELRWEPPGKTLEGSAVKGLRGYGVYRSTTGKPGSFHLLAESAEPRYSDQDFEFGRSYSYEVRALFKEGGTTAESEASQPYEVIARDIFPPARPTGLTALYTSGAVELVWTANSEKDLAGYYVYRRENGEKPKKLNEDLLQTPILRDASVEPGHTYFYQVTAVDLSKNESQPSGEVEVETRY